MFAAKRRLANVALNDTNSHGGRPVPWPGDLPGVARYKAKRTSGNASWPTCDGSRRIWRKSLTARRTQTGPARRLRVRVFIFRGDTRPRLASVLRWYPTV